MTKLPVDNQGGRKSGFKTPTLPDPGLTVTPDLFPNKLSGKGTRGSASGKFVPADPNAIERLAVQMDEKGYGLSDKDFAARFPDLVAGRDASIASAGINLSGQTDPLVKGTLATAGLDSNFGSTQADQARNMGITIADKENRDRNYFSRLLADNPQRAFGLNSQDVAHIALANTNGVNVNNQGQFGSRLNQYVAGVQQSAQNEAALIGGVGSLAGAAIKSYGNQNPYLSSAGYDYGAASRQFGEGNVGYNAAGAAGTYDSGGNFIEANNSGGF